MAGLFGRIAAGIPAVAAEAKSVGFSDALMAAMLGQSNAKSGVAVNVDTALKTTTFLAGIRVIAEGVAAIRSEEHTSELQSLMRNSYAVLCLKKKKINN